MYRKKKGRFTSIQRGGIWHKRKKVISEGGCSDEKLLGSMIHGVSTRVNSSQTAYITLQHTEPEMSGIALMFSILGGVLCTEPECLKGIDSKESILFNQSPLSAVMEQVTSQQCMSFRCHLYPSSSRALLNLQYSIGASKYLL